MIRVAADQIEEQGIEEREVAGSTTAVTDAADRPDCERFTLPLSPASKTTAEIYVRLQDFELDSDVPHYESFGLFNGESIFYGGDFLQRHFAVQDAARAIAAHAASSKKRNDKKAAMELSDWLTKIVEAGEEGASLLAGVEADWPASATDEDELKADGEINAAGPAADDPAELAGETEVADAGADAEISTPVKPTREEVIRQFEQRMARLAKRLTDVVLNRVSIESQLKSAKAYEKEIIAEIQSASSRGPEFMPLFDGDGESSDEPSTSPASHGEAGEQAPQSADAWKLVPIDDLGLPPKLTERLKDAGLNTMGELEAKRAEFNGLQSIEQVGPVAVTKIEAAVDKWLTANRDVAAFEEARAAAEKRAAEGEDAETNTTPAPQAEAESVAADPT